MDLSRGQFLLRGHDTIPRCPHKVSNGFPGARLVYSMCVLSSFRTFVGAAAAYVWLSCHVSCSDLRSMPSRLLRTSVDRSDEAFLRCCADNQISIYLPSIHTSNLIPFSLILFIQAHPDPIFHQRPHLLALSSSLPISSSTRAHASCIELRPPRLSAPAAASQPTTYEPTPIPSSIRTPSAMPPRLPLRPRHPSMQHATTSDFLAFPLKQQPLSRPPGVGLSTSSAASICAWI